MPHPVQFTLLAFLPLIVWRMVTRFRRMVGRQRLSRVRPIVQLVVFPLLLAFLALFAFPHWERLWWMAAGIALGAGLAVYGLKTTQFEKTSEGLFYTPNTKLGIAISLVLVLRIAIRIVQAFMMEVTTQPSANDFMRSPFTLIVLGLMGGYYVTYAAGLVRWRVRALRTE